MVAWYTKNLRTAEPAPKSHIHLTEFGDYTMCEKRIAKNGRWFIETNHVFLKSVNCKKCLELLGYKL
jgi:hypothetical protein